MVTPDRLPLALPNDIAMILWELLARVEEGKPLEPLDPAERGALLQLLGALERSDLEDRVGDWTATLERAYREGRDAQAELDEALAGAYEPAALLRVLGDKNLNWGDRQDALQTIRMANEGNPPDPDDPVKLLSLEYADVPEIWRSAEVVEALRAIATDARELSVLQDEAGEALASIWLTQDRFDAETFRNLVPAAREAAQNTLAAKRPEWLREA